MAINIADLRATLNFGIYGSDKLKQQLDSIAAELAKIESFKGPGGGNNQYTKRASDVTQQLVQAATQAAKVEAEVVKAASSMSSLSATSSQKFAVLNHVLETTNTLIKQVSNATQSGKGLKAFGENAARELSLLNDIVERRRELIPLAEKYASAVERANKYNVNKSTIAFSAAAGTSSTLFGGVAGGIPGFLGAGAVSATAIAAMLRSAFISSKADAVAKEAGTQFAELYRRQLQALVTRTPIPNREQVVREATQLGADAGAAQARAQLAAARAAADQAAAASRTTSPAGITREALAAEAAARERAAAAAQAHAEALRNNTAAQSTNAAAAQATANTLRDRLNTAMNSLFGLSMAMSGPLGSMTMRLWALNQAVETVGLRTTVMAVGLSTAAAGLAKFGSEAIRIERSIGPIREFFIQIGKVSGEDGKKSYEEMLDVMIKYGLSIDAVAKPLARLKIATEGTALGGAKFKQFAEDFSAIVSKFALPQDAIAGTAKAFEQMISKGTIQLEEFKNQLGDRFPAALRTGLLAFREYSGNSEARMKDFLSATKKGSIDSVQFLEIWIRKTKEVFGITNDATNNLNASYGRLSGVYTRMISNLDQSVGATKAWMSVLSGLTNILSVISSNADAVGPIIVASFGVAAVGGVLKLLNMLGVLNVRLMTVKSSVLAIGVAAGALALFANQSRAAALSTEELSKRAVDVAQELKRAGDNFSDFGRLNEVVTDAKGRMEALKQQTAQLRLELDASRGSLADRFMKPEDRAMLPEVTRRIRDLVGIRPSRDIELQISANEEAMRKLQSVLDSLGPAQQKFADGTRDVARALEEEVRSATSLPDKLRDVQAAIDEANIKLAILRNGGLGALQSSEGFDALLKKYGDGIRDISAAAQAANPELAAFVAKLKELQGKETELANARKAAESERKKASSLTGGGELSKAEGIIQRAEAIIEGAGISTGNNIRKMIKDLRDYQEALVATGMTNEEAAKKVEQFRTALEMQAAGINLASLQLKPLQAMQKGMESFADTLAGLLVDGKLNAKSFGDAFKQMAASIIKDIIAMTIKANILRPLLMGVFGMGGGGAFGLGGILGTQPVAFAKGGIVDDPMLFGFGGGKTGLMGEAGAEAIMPLRRGPDGSLGVAMHDAGGGGQAVNITFNVTSPDAGSFMKSEAQVAAMLSRVASRGSRNG